MPDETKQIHFKYLKIKFQLKFWLAFGESNYTPPTISSGNSVPSIPPSDRSTTTSPQTNSPSFSNHFVMSKFLGFLEITKIDKIPLSLQCLQKFWAPKTPTTQTDTGDSTFMPKTRWPQKVASHQVKRNRILLYVNYLKTVCIDISFMLLALISFTILVIISFHCFCVYVEAWIFDRFSNYFQNLIFHHKRIVINHILRFQKFYINKITLEKYPTYPCTQKYCHCV